MDSLVFVLKFVSTETEKNRFDGRPRGWHDLKWISLVAPTCLCFHSGHLCDCAGLHKRHGPEVPSGMLRVHLLRTPARQQPLLFGGRSALLREWCVLSLSLFLFRFSLLFSAPIFVGRFSLAFDFVRFDFFPSVSVVFLFQMYHLLLLSTFLIFITFFMAIFC